MKKEYRYSAWAIRLGLSERECPDCGAKAVYAYGILTDEEYKRRKCRDCGHEFEVEIVYGETG